MMLSPIYNVSFSCDAGSVVLSEVLEGLALPFHILSADDDVEEFVWEMLVHHFMDAVAIFGGDDTNLGSSLFRAFSTATVSGKNLVLAVICMSASFTYSFYRR